MIAKSLPFGHGRILVVGGLGNAMECIENIPCRTFAVMLPAFNDAERSAAEDLAAALIDSGCREFCCIGDHSEPLHDAIDWIVEDKGDLQIRTTWHRDVAEGCDYFVTTAGGGAPGLVALVSEHGVVVGRLQALVTTGWTGEDT